MKKVCRGCNKEKNLGLFYEKKGGRLGVTGRCRECYKRYREANSHMVARSKTLSLYKITKEQYDRLHEESNGLCAICNQPQPPGRFKRLCVDHDHETMKIRGLLCTNCNTGLGKFKDSFVLLESAADYVKKDLYKERS